jgi:hypothetical protein
MKKLIILSAFFLCAFLSKAAVCVMVTYNNNPYMVYDFTVTKGTGACDYIVQCTGTGFKKCPRTMVLVQDYLDGCGITFENPYNGWQTARIDEMAEIAFNQLEQGSTSGSQTITFYNTVTQETIVLQAVWNAVEVNGILEKTYTINDIS